MKTGGDRKEENKLFEVSTENEKAKEEGQSSERPFDIKNLIQTDDRHTKDLFACQSRTENENLTEGRVVVSKFHPPSYYEHKGKKN